jgi:single-stranded-DNA-specific exonuclease
MPLTGENRIIARHGIKQLFETRKTGLRALLRESGALEECNGNLRCWHIGFVLGPRLNAAGRIDDAARSLDLLLSTDDVEASLMAREIEAINKERKERQKQIVEEAIARVLEEGLDGKFAIVLGDKEWHPGIIGLVAGRLVEQFRRPAFVMNFDLEKGLAKGSARSIPGFNLYDAICAHSHLVSGGGHAMAAGFATEIANVDEVVRSFNTYASERLSAADFEVVLSADVQVDGSEVSFASVQALGLLEPYGCANPEPVFLARGMKFARVIPTKNPAHARVSLRHGSGPLMQGVAFSLGERLAELEPGFDATVLFQAKINEWKGTKALKWEIREFCVES